MSSDNGSKKVKVPYKFSTVELDSLKAHPKQAEVRQITDEALQGLGKFIDKVGLVEEIAINERTGHIISGHQRCKVLIDKGYTSAKVKVFDVDKDTEDLMFTNLNSQAISGAFTDEAKPWIQSLEARLGSELYQDVGLQMLEVSLADPEEVAKDGLTDPDDVPAIPKEAKTKLGDLYRLGRHRLLCGDATKPEDVKRLMGGEKADMVFTDPPYNINYGNSKHPKFKVRQIENDNMNVADYRLFCTQFVNTIRTICDNCVFVCHAPNQDGRILASVLDGELHCSTTIIWVKDVFTLGRGKYHNQYEPIWFGWSDSGDHFSADRSLSNVWSIERPKSSELHPTMKPVELVSRAIRNASSVGSITADIFLCSGTTMIACEQLDRKCYGIEIEPLYVDVSVKRWEEFTGKKAVLLKGA